MAQKTEKEEAEFKIVAENRTLCVNDCGVTGNPAMNNMCQKCFNASASASAVSVLTPPHKFIGGDKSPRSGCSRSPVRSSDPSRPYRKLRKQDRIAPAKETTETARKEVNRCSGCRRKVGLTGFRCRCGELFCAEHRYSDRHDCSYDYKAAGRNAIARENPVVKAAKIIRV